MRLGSWYMVMVCVVWVCGEMKDECVDGSKGDGRDPNFKSFCVCVCTCICRHVYESLRQET